MLIEINDLGQQVADAMQFELEYDNMMMVTQRGRAGQVLGGGFSGRGNQLGLRMTKGTKKIGTSNLKSLIEGDKLIIQDFEIMYLNYQLSYRKVSLLRQKTVLMTI